MSVFRDWHFVCRSVLSQSFWGVIQKLSIILRCATFQTGDDGMEIFKIITMIRPLADRVVIEPKAAETQTASGLYIPDTAKEKPQQGTVVAVGPGKKDEPMEVAVGDTVIYGKYSGTEVSVDGKDYLIMKQTDILAVL